MSDTNTQTAHPADGLERKARRRRTLKISLGVIVVILLVALCAAGNFLFDFALNPNGIYTMKMMQDAQDQKAKEDGHGEKADVEEAEARTWFKANRASCRMTADDGTELRGWYFAQDGQTGVTENMNGNGFDSKSANDATASHDYVLCLHGYTNVPAGMARYAKRFHDRGMTVLTPRRSRARALRRHVYRHGLAGAARCGQVDTRDRLP